MNQATNAYTVAIFGVLGEDQRALNRIFSLSSRRPRTYSMAKAGEEHNADMFIVDKSVAADLPRWEAARTQRPEAPTLYVTGEDGAGGPSSLRKPFMVTRVLGTLDKVAEQRPKAAPMQAAQAVPCGPGYQVDTVAAASAAEAPAQPTVPLNPATSDAPEAGVLRALVVDDSLTARKQLGDALARAQIESDIVEGGAQALERLEHKRYDIVLLDVVMPGVSGYEVCKTIKRNKLTKTTPVVMLTGKSSPFDKVKGKLSGCDSYLTKPVKLTEFKNTLERYLKQPIQFTKK